MLTTFFPRTSFKDKTIVDITKNVKLGEIIGNQAFTLQNFTVKFDERPEEVAFNYYDDVKMAWLVLLPNVYLDPYYEWPLTQRDLESWMKKKYGSLAAAQAEILFYEHNTKNITISKDTFDHNASLSYITGGDYSSVDAWTYYERVNDNKRHIKLIDKGFVPSIISQLKDLFPDS